MMVVRNNLPALNAQRNLTMNNSAVSKAVEKLASGFRINRSADDASGLAISEKMRAQITGLEQAQNNVQDGISFIQTAEGAMDEIHTMLNRLDELAVKAANGIYANEDRVHIQDEVEQLKKEIDRIDQGTFFNNIPCFDYGNKVEEPPVVEPPVGGGSEGTIKAGMNPTGVHIDEAVKAGDSCAHSAIDLTVSGARRDVQVSFATSYSSVYHDYINPGVPPPKGKDIVVNWYSDPDHPEYDTLSITFYVDDYYNDVADPSVNYTYTQADIDDALDAIRNTLPDDMKNVKIKLEDAIRFTSGNTTAGIMWLGTNSSDFVIKTSDSATAQADKATYEEISVKANGTGTAYNGVMSLKYTNDVGKIGTVEFDGKLPTIYLEADQSYSVNDINTILTGAGAEYTILGIGRSGTESLMGSAGNELNILLTGGADPYVDPGDGGDGGGGGTGGGGNDDDARKLTLLIGDTWDSYNQLDVPIYCVDSNAIGIGNIDFSTYEGAGDSIKKIKTAINDISKKRGHYGSLQNRLEHTQNNLGVTQENIMAAESRIRDTDMAKMMMEYTKSNILTQTAQAMLAQANQASQGVLQLIQ